MREQILAIVSHDLRNPLGTILMGTAVLGKDAPPEGERRRGFAQTLGRIERAAERMQRLIEDLLDFSSIEAGQLAIKRAPQNPGSMALEIVASFEAIARGKQLRLTAKVQSGLAELWCDRDRILQVLSNLVANATKILVAGGQITVSAELRGDEVLFGVSDTGPGISEEDQQHLFDRYWRSGQAQYKGTGLGLAIAKGIVGAHRGEIWVESKPGQGATFRFTVPLREPTPAQA